MNKKLHINQRVFLWTILYIIISFVVIIGFVIIYENCKKEVNQEKEHENNTMLEIFQCQMDEEIGILNDFTSKILLDNKITSLLSLDNSSYLVDPDLENSKYSLYECVNSVRNYSESGSRSKDTFVYFIDQQIAINCDIYQKFNYFYYFEYGNYGINYDSLKSIISEKYDRFNVFYIDGYWILVKTIPQRPRTTSAVNVVRILNADNLLPYTTALYQQRKALALVNWEDGKIIGENIDKIQNLNLDRIENENIGFFMQEIGNSNMILSYIKSGKENWSYVVINPQSMWFSDSAKIKRISYAFIIVYILISLVVVARLILDYIKSVEKISNAFGTDMKSLDYTFIENRINFLKDKSQQYVNQKICYKNELIRGLITTSSGFKLPNEDALRENGIVFQSDRYYFMVYEFQDEGSDKKKETYHFIINNISDEVLRSYGFIDYSIDQDNQQIYIINLTENTENSRKIIQECVNNVKSFVAQYASIPYRVALSGECEEKNDFQKNYYQIKIVLDYMKTHKDEEVVFYDDVKLNCKNSITEVPQTVGKAFVSEVNKGNAEMAYKQVNQFVEECKGQYMSFESISHFILHFMYELLDERKHLVKGSLSEENAELVEKIVNIREIDELMSSLKQLIDQICEEITVCRNKKVDEKQTRMVDEICRYIQDNYSDDSMTVTSISEHFECKQSVVSKIFKDAMGENISSYICKVRIEQAKKLIIEDQKLETVSQKCGFGSLRTFLRIFKQYEGITPTMYKQLQQ